MTMSEAGTMKGKKAVYNYTELSKRGTDPVNLLRKVLTKAPEVFEEFERGEIPTAYAAARKAGIVKEDSHFNKAVRLLPKLSRLELIDLQTRTCTVA